MIAFFITEKLLIRLAFEEIPWTQNPGTSFSRSTRGGLPKMERQTILLGFAAMILMSLIGFYAGFLMEERLGSPTNQTAKFSADVNYTVHDSKDIATAEFDDRSIDIIHGSGSNMTFYLDLDQDGSVDVEIDDLQRDGQTHEDTKEVDIENKTYRLHYRYRDSAEEEGDAQLWLYHVEAS